MPAVRGGWRGKKMTKPIFLMTIMNRGANSWRLMMVDLGSSGPSLAERLKDHSLIDRALARAVRDELLRHKQAGNPIAVWRDGRVVWSAPEDIPRAREP